MRYRYILILVCLLSCAAPAWAQTASNGCESVRFAFYDGSQLIQRNGVKRLYEADRAAAKEAEKWRDNPEAAQRIYDDQRTKLLDPVYKEAKAEIDKLAEEKHFLIFNLYKLGMNGSLLAMKKDLDITGPLIKFLNLSNNSPNKIFSVEPQPTRVGIIDSTGFFDPKTGITGFTMPPSGNLDDFCANNSKCEDIGNFIQTYLERNGYGAIFDLHKGLPDEIKNLACQPITSDFTSFYNKHKK